MQVRIPPLFFLILKDLGVNVAKRRKFDRAAWMVNRERFGLTDAEPPPEDDVVSIRDVLPGIFKKLEAARRPWLDELNSEWSSIAGDLTGAHARPGELRGQALVVYADSSTWLNDLRRFKSAELLKRIQARFGAERVSSLSFRLDPGRGGG